MIVINSILIEVILNMYLFLQYFNLGSKVFFIIFGCIYFVIYCLFPVYSKQYGKKLQILRGGLNLLSVFLITVTVQIILTLYLSFLSEIDSKSIILNTVIFFIGEFIIFLEWYNPSLSYFKSAWNKMANCRRSLRNDSYYKYCYAYKNYICHIL